jgi:hypothetical protein
LHRHLDHLRQVQRLPLRAVSICERQRKMVWPGQRVKATAQMPPP